MLTIKKYFIFHVYMRLLSGFNHNFLHLRCQNLLWLCIGIDYIFDGTDVLQYLFRYLLECERAQHFHWKLPKTAWDTWVSKQFTLISLIKYQLNNPHQNFTLLMCPKARNIQHQRKLCTKQTKRRKSAARSSLFRNKNDTMGWPVLYINTKFLCFFYHRFGQWSFCVTSSNVVSG